MIKLKDREQTLRYAKTKKTKTLREEEELEKKIDILQRQIDSGCNNANEKLAINIQLEQKTKKLEKIIEYRTKRAILRAKCRWYNEGEKNSTYILNLEKRQYKNSVISQLKEARKGIFVDVVFAKRLKITKKDINGVGKLYVSLDLYSCTIL